MQPFLYWLKAVPKSYRFNGTLGYIACQQHRFKVGGEYLAERLDFQFFHHHNHHWVHQWAIGGAYEYLLDKDCCQWVRSLDFSGYYARSGSKEISAVEGFTGATALRRIAGADIWNVEAGATFDTWDCGYLYVAIDYDSVDFRKHRRRNFFDDFSGSSSSSGSSGGGHCGNRRHDLTGVGATVALHQPIWCNVVLDVEYQYKRVYDFLEGLLAWNTRLECGDLTLGVYANHVWGHDKLPSSTTVGGQVGFSFGIESLGLFDNCCNPCGNDCCPYDSGDLAAWVSVPAVYIPQVLVRVEECFGPFASTIPNQVLSFGSSLDFATAPFFNTHGERCVRFSAVGLPAGFQSMNSLELSPVQTTILVQAH